MGDFQGGFRLSKKGSGGLPLGCWRRERSRRWGGADRTRPTCEMLPVGLEKLPVGLEMLPDGQASTILATQIVTGSLAGAAATAGATVAAEAGAAP